MSDQQLRDEVMTLFLAGHETTATALSWLWVLLADHADVEARVHAEVDRLDGRILDHDSLQQLPFTRAVLDETMRLFPPIWLIERSAKASDEIAGIPVPKGTIVGISPYLVHRHSDYWDDPEQFRPDRFLDHQARNSFAYIPFGAGPRTCIGADFATTEILLIAARIAGTFKLSRIDTTPVIPEPTITLRPRDKVMMKLARRKTDVRA